MLEASFELLIPLVVANLIDNGIAVGNNSVIVKSFIVMLLLGFVGLAASLTAQYFAARAAVNFAADLRHSLFGHLMKLDFTQIDNIGTPTMITRMTSDINQLQNGVNMVLRLFLRSPFVVFGAMVMAFTIDVECAFIFLLVIIVLSFVVFGLMIVDIRLAGKVQTKLDTVLSATRENLYGVRVIRAFNAEKFAESYKGNSEELQALLVGTTTDQGIFSRVENVITNALSSNGYFQTATNSFSKQISNLNDKITRQNASVANYKSRLEAKFSAMELLIANMQKQYSSFLLPTTTTM